MAIGMTLAEYWEGSPHLVKYYRQAHKLKMEQENQIAWMQGLYVKSALDSTLGNMFRKKGSKSIKYLEKPLEIFPKTEEEKEKEALAERQKAIDYFNQLIREQKKRKQSQKSGEIDGSNDRLSGNTDNQ